MEFGLGVGSSAIIILFLSRWLGRVWANRILEQDRAKYQREIEQMRQEGEKVLQDIRTMSEMDIFIHKLQFEKEFEIYLELWERIVAIRDLAIVLRLITDNYPNEPDLDEKQKRFEQLREAYIELKKVVENHKPFYAPEVYESAGRLLDFTFETARDFPAKLYDEEYFDKAWNIIRKTEPIMENICESIRKRIFNKKYRWYQRR